MLRACALLSLASVCMNTPRTIEYYPQLFYLTWGIDFIVTVMFTAELFAKVAIRGAFKVTEEFDDFF